MFKEYHDWVVQDIVFKPYNTVFRLERWEGPNGEYIVGKLPPEFVDSHFGSTLRSFILYQYYHCHVTQPLILEQLQEKDIDILSLTNEVKKSRIDTFPLLSPVWKRER